MEAFTWKRCFETAEAGLRGGLRRWLAFVMQIDIVTMSITALLMEIAVFDGNNNLFIARTWSPPPSGKICFSSQIELDAGEKSLANLIYAAVREMLRGSNFCVPTHTSFQLSNLLCSQWSHWESSSNAFLPDTWWKEKREKVRRPDQPGGWLILKRKGGTRAGLFVFN